MIWYSHLFQNFPQFSVVHTVKGFGIVNKAEIDVFLELSCFFDNPADVGNLISGSFAFSKTSLNMGFLFCSMMYISVFVPVPYCLDDRGFVIEPEVRQVDSSSFILLSEDCFGYLRFFCFRCFNFRRWCFSFYFLSLFFCMVLESVLVSFFYKWLTSFPSTTCKRHCLSSIAYSSQLVKDKVFIGTWI